MSWPRTRDALAAIAGAALFAVAALAGVHGTPPVAGGGQTVLFTDSFSGSSLNPAFWNTYMGSAGSNGFNWNSNGAGGSGLDPDPTLNADYFAPLGTQDSVSGSGLTITAIIQNITGPGGVVFPVTSGVATTDGKIAFDGGDIHVVAQVPGGDCSWPSIWLLPDKNSGATSDNAEIDIFEGGFTLSGHPTNDVFAGHLHRGGSSAGFTVDSGVDLTLAFHDYEVDWKPGVSITWYLDGVQQGQVLNATLAIPDETMELIFSQDCAGSGRSSFHTVFDGGTPSSMALVIQSVTWLTAF
jgi:beta-glucanase (GH16 family)